MIEVNMNNNEINNSIADNTIVSIVWNEIINVWFDNNEIIAEITNNEIIAEFPWTQWVPWIQWVTDPIILLSRQNFYVDTYSASNQILEWHREDGTTIVNTYSSNLLQTAVYTLPDTTVVTLTVNYDGNDRVISSLYS